MNNATPSLPTFINVDFDKEAINLIPIPDVPPLEFRKRHVTGVNMVEDGGNLHWITSLFWYGTKDSAETKNQGCEFEEVLNGERACTTIHAIQKLNGKIWV